jgi:hypothetical protein
LKLSNDMVFLPELLAQSGDCSDAILCIAGDSIL